MEAMANEYLGQYARKNQAKDDPEKSPKAMAQVQFLPSPFLH